MRPGNRPSPAVAFAALAAAVVLPACAAFQKMNALAAAGPHRPTFGALDSTALVVFECRVLFDPPQGLLDSAISDLLSLGPDDSADMVRGVLASESGAKVNGFVDAGWKTDLVFFAGLSPGTYELSSLVAGYDLNAEEKEEYYSWECDPDHHLTCPDSLELQRDENEEGDG